MRSFISIVVALCAPLVSAGSLRAESLVQIGWVQSFDTAIAGANVTLYLAGGQRGSGEQVLGSSPSGSDGSFIIPFHQKLNDDSVLYVIADGGNAGATARLAAVIGSQPLASGVTINERTTVATAVAMAQFIDGTSIGGKWPGLQNAAGTFRNLVDPANGNVGNVLGSTPNGTKTSTMATFNSLANILAGCVSGLGNCALLFANATPPGGQVPHETLQAAINIARNAWQNPDELFALSLGYAPYQPALILPPPHWALAIKYVGNGKEFDGPGAMAFDERGDVWISNNYIYKKNHATPTCGGNKVLKLTATGQDFPGAPYDGKKGGLDGVGFGITLDPSGRVWLSNFGFFGNTCPENLRPPSNSLTLFSSSGAVLSPRDGIMQGCINSPQGIVSDVAGNIWIANTCNGSVTRYHNGDPNDHWVYEVAANRLAAPQACPSDDTNRVFAIAIDAEGNAWISNNTAQFAFKLSPEGQLLARSAPDALISKPLGIAIDSRGHVWISNTGILTIPCAATSNEEQNYGDLQDDPQQASITELDSNGAHIGTYQGGGVQLPWGLAVDGDDRPWIANFGGQTLSVLDANTGTPVAPNGYFSDALMRCTGVSIDPSGNVWLVNNWLIESVQTNPGGDGVVVFIGLASPVKTPLLGPPQQP